MSDDLSSTRDAPVQPGDVLAGKYQVERVLGAGGMGVVVAARHLELDERVAVKFLLPDAVESQEAAARFVREARAAVKIKSEHVARVIDVGRLENGAPYMVMEYLEGRDLAHVIDDGPAPIESAVEYVIQACDAMAEAHAIGIVHRDLKPANLFLTTRSDGAPVVKVLDFGISKYSVPELQEASLTRTSTAMGSPLYMSPEQMRSAKDVDQRTDIWALGTILYELFTGATPFRATSYPELCALIMASPPRPVRELRPEVPLALEAVVLRCLEKVPSARFANVAELAAALAPFAPRGSRATVERVSKVLSRAGISGTDLELPISVAEPSTVPVEAGTKTAWAETAPPNARGRAPLLAAAAALLVGLIVAGVLAMRSRAEPEPAAGPAETGRALPEAAAAAPQPAPPAPPAPVATASAEPEPEPEASAPPKAPIPAPRPVAKPAGKPPAPPPAPEPPEPAKPPPPPPPVPEKPKPKNPLDIGLK